MPAKPLIYIGHSRGPFDYLNELYRPIRESLLGNDFEIVFPHEEGVPDFSSKKLFQKGCDLFIAEVSFPSTGLGIEIGIANMLGVPIACIHKSDAGVSSSLRRITNQFIAYKTPEDLLRELAKLTDQLK